MRLSAIRHQGYIGQHQHGRSGKRMARKIHNHMGAFGDDGSDPTAGMTDDQYSAYWAANEPDGDTDTSDYSGDYQETQTGTSTTAPTGGSDYFSTIASDVQGLFPSIFGTSSAGASSGAMPSGSASYTAPGVTASVATGATPAAPATGLTAMLSNPMVLLGAGGLILVLLMSGKKS